jgi:hypothetical protein
VGGTGDSVALNDGLYVGIDEGSPVGVEEVT